MRIIARLWIPCETAQGVTCYTRNKAAIKGAPYISRCLNNVQNTNWPAGTNLSAEIVAVCRQDRNEKEP